MKPPNNYKLKIAEKFATYEQYLSSQGYSLAQIRAWKNEQGKKAEDQATVEGEVNDLIKEK